LSQTIQSEEMK